MFLDKTPCFHCSSLYPGVLMDSGKYNAGGGRGRQPCNGPHAASHPGRNRNPPSHIMCVLPSLICFPSLGGGGGGKE